MLKKMTRIVAAFAVLLTTSTVAFAADQKASGTIVAVTEEIIKMKGADGKTYEIKAEDVMAESLKTGDTVEYLLVEGKPVHVLKKAAK